MAEKEFIEREAAISVLCDACGNAACPKGLIPRCSYYEKMQSIPASDVRPVVRGKWETVMLDHERMGCRPTAHYCSECHHITWFRTFFCPNCGADMREES